MEKRNTSYGLQHLLLSKSKIKQATNQRQKPCTEKATATKMRWFCQVITKCMGFCIRMSWVQFLVQKLLICMKLREVTNLLYTSEPLSVNGANTICLEVCERIRNNTKQLKADFGVRWVWVRSDYTCNSLGNLSLRFLIFKIGIIPPPQCSYKDN